MFIFFFISETTREKKVNIKVSQNQNQSQNQWVGFLVSQQPQISRYPWWFHYIKTRPIVSSKFNKTKVGIYFKPSFYPSRPHHHHRPRPIYIKPHYQTSTKPPKGDLTQSQNGTNEGIVSEQNVDQMTNSIQPSTTTIHKLPTKSPAPEASSQTTKPSENMVTLETTISFSKPFVFQETTTSSKTSEKPTTEQSSSSFATVINVPTSMITEKLNPLTNNFLDSLSTESYEFTTPLDFTNFMSTIQTYLDIDQTDTIQTSYFDDSFYVSSPNTIPATSKDEYISTIEAEISTKAYDDELTETYHSFTNDVPMVLLETSTSDKEYFVESVSYDEFYLSTEASVSSTNGSSSILLDMLPPNASTNNPLTLNLISTNTLPVTTFSSVTETSLLSTINEESLLTETEPSIVEMSSLNLEVSTTPLPEDSPLSTNSILPTSLTTQYSMDELPSSIPNEQINGQIATDVPIIVGKTTSQTLEIPNQSSKPSGLMTTKLPLPWPITTAISKIPATTFSPTQAKSTTTISHKPSKLPLPWPITTALSKTTTTIFSTTTKPTTQQTTKIPPKSSSFIPIAPFENDSTDYPVALYPH